jgi:hypothetical protein
MCERGSTSPQKTRTPIGPLDGNLRSPPGKDLQQLEVFARQTARRAEEAQKETSNPGEIEIQPSLCQEQTGFDMANEGSVGYIPYQPRFVRR